MRKILALSVFLSLIWIMPSSAGGLHRFDARLDRLRQNRVQQRQQLFWVNYPNPWLPYPMVEPRCRGYRGRR